MTAAVDSGTVVVENRYASSTMNTNTEGANESSTSSDGKSPVLYSQEMLQAYYSHLFPYSFMYSWLSYGNNNRIFSNREFSFTIEPAPGEEIYLRYQSFHSEEEMQKAIIKRCPKKIDIGAIFSQCPKDKSIVQSGAVTAEARELIFDIDMDDYDGVRNCGCSGANICKICWGFMKMAVKVLDKGLREDFGFQHIAWFYSGRRGIHAWICDEEAVELTNEARGAIVKYFQLELGSEKNKDSMDLPNPLHPMLRRSFDILEPMFIENVISANGHGLLASSDQWNSLLDDLPKAAEAVQINLSKQWAKDLSKTTPLEKWEELKKHMNIFLKQSAKVSGNKAAKSMTNKEKTRLETWIYEVVFRYTYPRLDMHVSMMRNHLLKSPFCVHPKSGRVCVPIEADKVDEFDPFSVPTLPQVVAELDQYNKGNDDEDEDAKETRRNMPNWQKTSLKKYYGPFQKDFLDPLVKKMRRKERDRKEREAALLGDF